MASTFIDICIKLLMEKLGHPDYEVIVVPKKNKKDTFVNKIQQKSGKEIQIITLKKYNSSDKTCIQILRNGEDYYKTSSLTIFINKTGTIPSELSCVVNIFMTYKTTVIPGVEIIGHDEIEKFIKDKNLVVKKTPKKGSSIDMNYEIIRDYYALYKKYPIFSEDEKTYKAIRNVVKMYNLKALSKEYIEAFELLPEWKWDYYRLKDNGIILYSLMQRADKKKILPEEIKAYKKFCKDINGKDMSEWFKDQVTLSGLKSFL